jgi:hypothetical protein
MWREKKNCEAPLHAIFLNPVANPLILSEVITLPAHTAHTEHTDLPSHAHRGAVRRKWSSLCKAIRVLKLPSITFTFYHDYSHIYIFGELASLECLSCDRCRMEGKHVPSSSAGPYINPAFSKNSQSNAQCPLSGILSEFSA